VKSGHWNKGT